MNCRYCNAECNSTFSPGDNKAEKFPACNWQHAYNALNLELVLSAWRTA